MLVEEHREKWQTWLDLHPINAPYIETAIKKLIPNYEGTNAAKKQYTYLSKDFVAHVFSPLLPNTPLLRCAEKLAEKNRLTALIGVCLIIPELFIRTILNLTLTLKLAIERRNDPSAAEFDGVRYSINAAAPIGILMQCLVKIAMGSSPIRPRVVRNNN